MGFIKMDRLTLTTLLLVLILPVPALPVEPDAIPPELEHWRPWVLHGLEDRFCPTQFDNGDVYQCRWPSRLELDLQSKQGRFSQQWLIFSKRWVPLPGGDGLWPMDVQVDGESVMVVGRNNAPSVYLTPGTHRVQGGFSWEEMPEMIHVPPASGLIALTIGGKPVEFPVIDEEGRLWLKRKPEIRREEDVIELKVYRLLMDSIPMQVTNLLRLNIAGRAREIRLKDVLLENAVVMKLDSPLAARLGRNGDLMIQGRPGRWEIMILSRQKEPVRLLRAPLAVQGQEIWAFQSQNHLRMVNIKGIPAVDPQQTDVPPGWRSYPTFILEPGAEMTFEEIRRGDPDPAPDRLDLKRTWWLDFDGRGFTIQDQISGRVSRRWYLAMNPPGELGRVAVDGIDQLITSHGPQATPGVELRKGELALVSEARLEGRPQTIPAVGWDHDFDSVSGVLNLPPGWRLLTAGGVDVLSGTWFERWSLLDLFVVLIVGMAVWKLWNRWWGLLALLTLALIYHEPGAPRLVWLNLLAAITLIRFLPQGWVKKLTNFWRWASVVALLVLSIPFIVQQVRWGIYPQLEPPEGGAGLVLPIGPMAKRPVVMEEAPVRQDLEQWSKSELRPAAPAEMQSKTAYLQRQAVLTQDPNALVQTGPGLPAWRWRTIALRWSGPVAQDQQIRLWLLSPAVNFALSLLRAGFLALLIFGVMDFRHEKGSRERFAATAAMILLLAIIGPAATQVNAQGYPSPQLLDQLKQRLLEKPDCLPHCADSPRMHLTAAADRLQILLDVHAAADTAVPLPGSLKTWVPEQVLVDNQPARGLLRDQEGWLWVQLDKGTHEVTLLGAVPPLNSFQLPLPLQPRRVTVESQAWTVEGVNKDGQVAASIRLISSKKDMDTRTAANDIVIAAFFQVERLLSLGLDWQIATTVKRLTPTGTPAMLTVPLLDGESVTTAGIQVQDKSAHIALDPKMTEITWSSSLKRSDAIQLTAPASVPWSETWILDASPIWHCELSGIAVIHHQDQAGYWRPQWRPWPGESATVRITRPEAIAGQIVTMDQAKLDLTPGKRYTRSELALQIRTSKGGQHQVVLPDGAGLTSVSINGQSQPIRQMAREVTIPLNPGSQIIRLEWHQNAAHTFVTRAPAVHIGANAVNAEVTIRMPHNRWILWGHGPRLGPAVLFWSYLGVVILAAIGLGKITWTPLKTYHWFLLGLGLTQVHTFLAIVVIGWLLALGLRQKRPPTGSALVFDLSQLTLVFWTTAALICMYLAIRAGLLGIPHMQIAGNGSSSFLLHWTQDRIGATMPRPWVVTVPMWVFRVLMLLWALWLAYSLLKWLRWGWQCFNQGGLWKKMLRRKKKKAPAPPPLPSRGLDQESEA